MVCHRGLIGTRRPALSGAHVPAQFHRAPGNFTPQKPFASELAPPEQIETHTCLLKESRIAGAYGLTTRPVAKRPGSRGFAMSNLDGRTEEVFSRSYDKGHFICHGAGGGCDWNLFPRVRSLNRGWTDEEVLYVAGCRSVSLAAVAECADNFPEPARQQVLENLVYLSPLEP